MEIKKGIPVSPGVVIARAFVLESEDVRIPRRHFINTTAVVEIDRFRKALGATRSEIAEIRDRILLEQSDPSVAAIFVVHQKILEDDRLSSDVADLISQRSYSAEYAVSRALRPHIKRMQGLEDDYLRERASDFRDIERRLLKNLVGQRREELSSLKHKVVVVARDLTPSQTASLERDSVVGFATDVGGRTSHTAIVARALEIPAVVALGDITTDVSGGDMVIVDGNRGIVIVEPDEDTIRKYEHLEDNIHELEVRLSELRDLPAQTRDGTVVQVYGNIEFPNEITTSIEKGAGGIGLYRTEFLYLETVQTGKHPPTEREHFETYLKAVQLMGGRPLVIRTLDLGADKFPPEMGGLVERNPFLGSRSLRYCFQHPELLKTQVRAILRASAFGQVSILLPMVSTLDDLRRARNFITEGQNELTADGIPFKEDIKVGAMIEVPSAALIADRLADECDFFSIGTNDLIQYTLAVDRGNQRVAERYNPADPAILSLLRRIIAVGQEKDIPVAMCGEMSGDIDYTILLLGMGLRVFSLSPLIIPEIKEVIRSVDISHAEQIAARAMTFSDPKETLLFLRQTTRELVPDLYLDTDIEQ